MRLGVGDAFVEQPSVQFVKVLEPQPRREEALAHEPNLVLDLALLPARCRGASDRVDQIMAAHLQEAAIVDALLADEDHLPAQSRPGYRRYGLVRCSHYRF